MLLATVAIGPVELLHTCHKYTTPDMKIALEKGLRAAAENVWFLLQQEGRTHGAAWHAARRKALMKLPSGQSGAHLLEEAMMSWAHGAMAKGYPDSNVISAGKELMQKAWHLALLHAHGSWNVSPATVAHVLDQRFVCTDFKRSIDALTACPPLKEQL